MAPLVGALAAALLSSKHQSQDALDETNAESAAKVFALFVLGRPPRPNVDLVSASDLRSRPRNIAVVTTAALPWMTGTAVNPLLRAVHLARDGHIVTLVLPWVRARESQMKIFGGRYFRNQEEQRAHIIGWLASNRFDDVLVRLLFYDGVYSQRYGSILPLSAITDVFTATPDLDRDVCILEEPEHLTWHHPGSPWPSLFRIVIGVIHTNYIEYARQDGLLGHQRAFALLLLNIWVARSYCHRIIKLSDAVQHFPHSVTENVHGVRQRFIEIGCKRSRTRFTAGAYFLAKTLWTKGYAHLLNLLRVHYARTGKALPIRFFGDGADAPAVLRELQSDAALSRVYFEPRIVDHASDELQRYRVYVNASVSEVVCTATAEALAMGKTVLIIEHTSNDFFSTFPNCHIFRTSDDFSHMLERALSRDPLPLSEEDAYRLSWRAATRRFYDAARVPEGTSHPRKMDEALANAHIALSKIYPNPALQIRRIQDDLFRDSEDDVEGSLALSDVSDNTSLS